MGYSDISVKITAANRQFAAAFAKQFLVKRFDVQINIVDKCNDFKCIFCDSLPFLEDDITSICNLLAPFTFTQVEISTQKPDCDVEIFLGTKISPDQLGIQIFAESEQSIDQYQKHLSDFTISASGIRNNPVPKIVYGTGCDLYWANYMAWLAHFSRETEFIQDDLINEPMLALFPVNEEQVSRLNRNCLPITIRTDDHEAGAKLQAHLRALGFTVKTTMLFPDSTNLHHHFCMRLACVALGVALPNNYDVFTEELMASTQSFLSQQLHIPDDYPFMFESTRRSCLTGMVIDLPFGSFKKGEMPAYRTLGSYDCLIVTDKPNALKPLRKRLLAAGMGSVEIKTYDEKPMLRGIVFAKDILGDATGMEMVLALMSDAIDAQEIPELKVRRSLAPLANIVVRMPIKNHNHLPDTQPESDNNTMDET